MNERRKPVRSITKEDVDFSFRGKLIMIVKVDYGPDVEPVTCCMTAGGRLTGPEKEPGEAMLSYIHRVVDRVYEEEDGRGMMYVSGSIINDKENESWGAMATR